MEGLFQAVARRMSIYYIINFSYLAPGFLVFYIVIMDISDLPIITSLRPTNVYEERALGMPTSSGSEAYKQKCVGAAVNFPYESYSLLGSFRKLSMLIWCIVMLRRRRWILPMAIDRAVVLLGQRLMERLDQRHVGFFLDGRLSCSQKGGSDKGKGKQEEEKGYNEQETKRIRDDGEGGQAQGKARS
ncbi:MAG: hypothetical protein M1827_005743 [Pycnora praestabilis]|nr:MAG: hypothetical protein M1827_005743 [Pycnora praestabilis]